MKNLKHIRVILSIIFLMEATAFVVLGASAPAHTSLTFRIQVIPSMITASMGATLTWIVVTLLAGRIYCSTVCPLGTLQDAMTFTRKKLLRRPLVHRFKPERKIRYDILILYVALTIAGASFGALLEPWSWFDGIVGTVGSEHEAAIISRIVADAGFGIIIALAAFAVLATYATLTGRDFCNHICPIGTAMGIVSTRAALHIEIDPDRCTSCMKCEDGCKASCISVKDRIVDNTRCVRCFNCIAHCPNDAIRLQINRNGVMSPMLRRNASTTPSN